MTDLSHIIEPLRDHAVPVDELHIDPANANTHPEPNLRAIMKSLREFGQRQVLVARQDNNTIVAGNGRLECARKLDWSHVACVFVDDDDITALRYAVADNRSSELSEWDEEVLAQTLEAIDSDFGTLEGTGFDESDLSDLLDAIDENDGLDNEPVPFDESWEVRVECESESEQLEVMQLLEREGYECQALIL